MISELEAENFRNLEPLRRSFAAGSHLLLGDNGAGKTSLLEAIYALATTRSFRTSQIADCRRHGAAGFRLAAEVQGERRARLEIGWHEGQRRRSLNGNRSTLAEHLAVQPVVCWTASDVDVLIGPPVGRRRFLDRGVVGLRPSSIAALARYRRALGEKRQLLLRGGSGLSAWNRVVAEAAAEVIGLRSRYVESLDGELSRAVEIAGLDFADVTLAYRPSPGRGVEGPEAIFDEIERSAPRERRAGRPLLGPHRDELEIRWRGHELRRVASAGERKALGLALVASQGRLLTAAGREPIYLLDDADVELDHRRLEALWRVFAGATQLFATSNRPQAWSAIEIDHGLRLEAGRLEAVASDRA